MQMREKVADAFKRYGLWEVDRLELADAAIAAVFDSLAEPSEGMVRAGVDAWTKSPMAVVTQFRAMIAQARKEQEGGK